MDIIECELNKLNNHTKKETLKNTKSNLKSSRKNMNVFEEIKKLNYKY